MGAKTLLRKAFSVRLKTGLILLVNCQAQQKDSPEIILARFPQIQTVEKTAAQRDQAEAKMLQFLNELGLRCSRVGHRCPTLCYKTVLAVSRVGDRPA